MIERYGKQVNMQNVRDLSVMEIENDSLKKAALKFYKKAEEKENSICRICGSSNTRLYHIAYGDYEYYECGDCEALYLDNLPRIDEMYQGNDELNSGLYMDEKTYDVRKHMIFGPKIEFVLEICTSCGVDVNKWVDIGTGGAHALMYLKENTSIEGIGIESDPSEYNFALNKGMKVINGFFDEKSDNVEILNAIRNSDVVSLFCVLEHLESPKSIIEFLYNNMKERAVLVVEVPRHPSLASFANITQRDYIVRHITPPNHLQIFSEKSMNYLFMNKFELVGKWGYGLGFTDLLNNAMMSAHITQNNIYEQILGLSNDVQLVFDKAGLSDFMIFVAMKI